MHFSFVMKYIQNKLMQHSAISNCQLLTFSKVPFFLSYQRSWIVRSCSFVLVRSPLTCDQLQEALTDMLSFTRGLTMQLSWFPFHDGRWRSVHLIGCSSPESLMIKTRKYERLSSIRSQRSSCGEIVCDVTLSKEKPSHFLQKQSLFFPFSFFSFFF